MLFTRLGQLKVKTDPERNSLPLPVCRVSQAVAPTCPHRAVAPVSTVSDEVENDRAMQRALQKREKRRHIEEEWGRLLLQGEWL
jgi:hypothetical protein